MKNVRTRAEPSPTKRGVPYIRWMLFLIYIALGVYFRTQTGSEMDGKRNVSATFSGSQALCPTTSSEHTSWDPVVKMHAETPTKDRLNDLIQHHAQEQMRWLRSWTNPQRQPWLPLLLTFDWHGMWRCHSLLSQHACLAFGLLGVPQSCLHCVRLTVAACFLSLTNTW